MVGTRVEERGLLEGGADPGYGSSQRLDLVHKAYPLKIFQEDANFTYDPVEMDALDYIDLALNERIPPICAMGMQRMEGRLVDAASQHASDIIDAGEHPNEPPLKHLEGEAKRKRMHEKKSLATIIREEWKQEHQELESHLVHVIGGPPLKTAVMLSSIWYALVGYNIGIMNVTEAVIFPDYSMVSWAWAVAAYPVGGLIGALLGMRVADKQGRCPALMIATILFLTGGIFQALAPRMPLIQMTRLLLGIAAGMFTTIVPVYLGEIAPANMRGVMGGRLNRFTAIGLVASFAMPFLLNESSWRVWVSVNIILPLFPLLQISNLVESPRWMLQQQEESQSMQARREARINLARLRAAGSTEEVETEALTMIRPQEDTRPTAANKHKRRVFACCALQITQQLSGVYAILYYSNFMLGEFTEFANVATLTVGFFYCLATSAGSRNSLLKSNLSRRHKLIWLKVSMMVVAILLRVTWGRSSMAIIVILLEAYVVLFAIGLEPLPNLLVVELLDVANVTKVHTLSQQVNWAVHGIVAFAFPFLWKALGRSTFEIIIGFLVISTAVTPQLVPGAGAVGKTTRQFYSSLKHQRPVGSLHLR